MNQDGSVHGWREEGPLMAKSSAIMAPMTGRELRTLRERAGWTQARLATLCEVSWRSLVRWEQAKKVPVHSVAAAYIRATLEAEAARQK